MGRKWVAGAAGPLLALAFWSGVEVGERRAHGTSGTFRAPSPVSASAAPEKPGGRISLQELRAAIEGHVGALRLGPVDDEGRRELVKGWVRFELMAREALRKGYGNDPELARQAKRSLVARFLERELEEPLARQPVEEAELREFYEAHRADYQHPERVRLCDRLFEAGPGVGPERAHAKAAAQAFLAEVRQGESSVWDLGFLTRPQLEVKAGPKVAEAAFAEELRGPGAEAGAAVETPQGYHAVKVLGREGALDQRLEDVREAIRRRILFERKSRAYEKLARELEERAGVSADAGLLDTLGLEGLHAP